MDVKSLGLLRSGRGLDEERERTAEKLRSQSAFQRATPPEASSTSTFNQDQVGDGLLRMADFIKKFQSKDRKAMKKSKPGKSGRHKAISAYQRVSQSETEDSGKGCQFSKFV